MFGILHAMTKMIQLRHVPDSLHKRLKTRAKQEGLTLSAYLIREAAKLAARPTMAEMMARLASREPVTGLSESPAEIIRAARDERDKREW
jgi:antitoxin FitA